MSAPGRFAGKEPTICACCQRLAEGFAYHPYPNPPRGQTARWLSQQIWFCGQDAKALDKTKSTGIYKMPAAKMEMWEKKANAEAETEVASYCEEIGTSDFAKMTEQERD